MRNRRRSATRPVTHYGERVYPHEVELPERDMDLDRPRTDQTLAEIAAEWQAQIEAERRTA